jgi:hypothetical protein
LNRSLGAAPPWWWWIISDPPSSTHSPARCLHTRRLDQEPCLHSPICRSISITKQIHFPPSASLCLQRSRCLALVLPLRYRRGVFAPGLLIGSAFPSIILSPLFCVASLDLEWDPPKFILPTQQTSCPSLPPKHAKNWRAGWLLSFQSSAVVADSQDPSCPSQNRPRSAEQFRKPRFKREGGENCPRVCVLRSAFPACG